MRQIVSSAGLTLDGLEQLEIAAAVALTGTGTIKTTMAAY
jgi:hypothetical protein